MSELFPIESVTVDSPRLAWMKKFNLHTERTQLPDDDEFSQWPEWICWNDPVDRMQSGYCGATEDAAIANWAKNNKVPLWNEEQFVKEKAK